MLEVGNGQMTPSESRAHFSLWCMLAAPLIAGNDVRNMKPEIQEILTNREAIALDQDRLGKQATRFRADENGQVWVKELADGQWGICLFNTTSATEQMKLNWSDLAAIGTGKYRVRDLWARKDLGDTGTNLSAEVASHDVALLRLEPAK